MKVLHIKTPETGRFLQVDEAYFAEHFPDNKFSFRVNGYVYLDEEDVVPFLASDQSKADIESIVPAEIDQDVLEWTLIIFAAIQSQHMFLNGHELPEEFQEIFNKDSDFPDFPEPQNKTLQ